MTTDLFTRIEAASTRRTALHEASHAIAARRAGLWVDESAITGPDHGHTAHQPTPHRHIAAAIALAPLVIGDQPSADDFDAARRRVTNYGANAARAAAEALLDGQREYVDALGDELIRLGVVDPWTSSVLSEVKPLSSSALLYLERECAAMW